MLNKKEIEKWKDLIPEAVTLSAALFFNEQEKIESLRWYFVAADKLLYDNMETTKKFFLDILKEVQLELTESMVDSFNNGAAERIFNSNTYMLSLSQMAFTRCVDNFLIYLKDLLSEVVIACPDILKSSEKEQLDYILSFESMEEFQKAMAEKKVESLFYSGMNDVAIFFEKRLGERIFSTNNLMDDVVLLTKYRNLIVHNRGRISNDFLKFYPNSKYQKDDLISFEWQDISTYNLLFQKIIVRIDKIIAKKYNLNVLKNQPVSRNI